MLKNKLHKFVVFSAVLATLILSSPPAYSCQSNCPDREHEKLQQIIENRHIELREHISEEMKKHQLWFMGASSNSLPGKGFFADFIAPAMTVMTESLTVTGMHQIAILGKFFDAEQQLNTQRLFHQLTAEAHKDYHVSTDLCTIGTGIRGLAAAERHIAANASVMLRHSQNRQLGYRQTTTAEDLAIDRQSRLDRFKTIYCDPSDLAGTLIHSTVPTLSICNPGPGWRPNRDISYTQQLGIPRTIDVNFTDTVTTPAEEDLLALSTYLFAHSPPSRISEALLINPANHDEYLDLRALVAKRSLLLNSFFNIASLKSQSSITSDETGNFVAGVFNQLGVPAGEAELILGERPSYYALMEIVAQKLYQDPEFYSNLYDKPANVLRKEVAMQAIDLMLTQDLYYSELRTESILALWLELETMNAQTAVQNRIGWLDDTMEEN